jgi:tetratricopeptide (TPR) repeat protein/tRNA A-37 threonylcarbamoyl transferase component Bud32
MGAVFRAHDPDFDRNLAIKVMLQRPDQTDAEARFFGEARLMGRLQHPGIAPVHELGRLADGRPFFTMKLIEGRTLAELLRGGDGSGRHDLARFLGVFEQVCQTLAYAHSMGVIHRDLKPANIMVGAFGEVQVMDWGLAKVIADWAKPALEGHTPSDEQNLQSTIRNPQSVELTQAGRVLGTLAFMAPEQARGEAGRVDERADVFGLGAILCVLLTGKPPYEAGLLSELLELARRGSQQPAQERLDSCGVDAALVQLCKHCLAPDRDSRPCHAGEVAEAVSEYRAAVARRLHQAELERTAAQARAKEARRRVRLAVALAAAVLLLALGGFIAWTWQQQDRAERRARRKQAEREVTAALQEAERGCNALAERLKDARQAAVLLSDLGQWEGDLLSIRQSWQRADTVARGNQEGLSPALARRLKSLEERLQAAQRDYRLARELDEIRLEASLLVEEKFNLAGAAPKYEKVLCREKLDLRHGTLKVLADRIRGSSIRPALVGALDHWAMVLFTEKEDEAALAARLLEVARRADPDPWRDRFRRPEVWGSPERLRKLAATVDTARQPPQILTAVVWQLNRAGGDARPLLRAALVQHPRDFWLHFIGGEVLREPAEQVGAYQAALALRPRSNVAYGNVGNALIRQRDWAGAAAAYRRALDLDPRNEVALIGLGSALRGQKKLAAARATLLKALDLNPKSGLARVNLGVILTDQGDETGALTAFRRAIHDDPKYPLAWFNLGNILHMKGELDEALKAYRHAVKLAPLEADAWTNLGHVLKLQGKLPEAIDALRKAVQLNPRNYAGYQNLGIALSLQEDLPGALAALLKATEIAPTYALAHYDLALVYYKQKRLRQAIEAMRKSVALDSSNAQAFANLGMILLESGRPAEAQEATERALALVSAAHPGRPSLLHQLRECERMLAGNKGEGK